MTSEQYFADSEQSFEPDRDVELADVDSIPFGRAILGAEISRQNGTIVDRTIVLTQHHVEVGKTISYMTLNSLAKSYDVPPELKLQLNENTDTSLVKSIKKKSDREYIITFDTGRCIVLSGDPFTLCDELRGLQPGSTLIGALSNVLIDAVKTLFRRK